MRLVAGPSALATPPGVERIDAVAAADRWSGDFANFRGAQSAIIWQAVADFRPRNPAAQKVKKNSNGLMLDLAPIADELPGLSAKKAGRLMIGFAAETEDLEVHALDKLRRKKLDLIVGNDVSRSDAGFGVDTNIVTMLSADGRVETTPKLLKDEVADVILDRLLALRAIKVKPPSLRAAR